jgi:pimeloyl-ACP methyl ester carboxylesterase
MTAAKASDGSKLAYQVHGTGAHGVVLVHGWAMSGALWDDVLMQLSLEGLKLVVVDLRGSGGSDKPPTGYSIGRFGEDVLAVADHAGLKTFSIIGHSMGGLIAQWIAATEPARVTALMLINPVPARGLNVPPDAAALFSGAGGKADAMGMVIDMSCRALTPKGREKLLAISVEVAPGAVAESFDAWTHAHFEDKLPAISCPTLVVGNDDPFLTPALLREAVARKIRGARQAYMPGSGHYPQVEKPRETAALMEAFLVGVSA